eukprot:scaffold195679_cov29-Tisochrysis_lutea.AAC.4
MRFGQPTPILLSSKKPSGSRYESLSVPPIRLMIWGRATRRWSALLGEGRAGVAASLALARPALTWIWSRLVEPRSFMTASTAICAKCSLSWDSTCGAREWQRVGRSTDKLRHATAPPRLAARIAPLKRGWILGVVDSRRTERLSRARAETVAVGHKGIVVRAETGAVNHGCGGGGAR